jgi:hypothetical protein
MSSGLPTGLHQVDWARISHAYGAATDIPDQLRALRAADPHTRVAACQQLRHTIVHQASRYEATAYSVPFRVDLLADAGTDQRPDLAGLLAAITLGYDENWLPDALPTAAPRAYGLPHEVDAPRRYGAA